MPSNHLILCHPLLLLPSIFPSIRVFSNESVLPIWLPKYWNFSFSISPSNEHSGLISFRTDWFDLLAVQGILKSLLPHHSSKASILHCSAFFIVQLSHPYMTTGKTILGLEKYSFFYSYSFQTTNVKNPKIFSSALISQAPLLSVMCQAFYKYYSFNFVTILEDTIDLKNFFKTFLRRKLEPVCQIYNLFKVHTATKRPTHNWNHVCLFTRAHVFLPYLIF